MKTSTRSKSRCPRKTLKQMASQKHQERRTGLSIKTKNNVSITATTFFRSTTTTITFTFTFAFTLFLLLGLTRTAPAENDSPPSPPSQSLLTSSSSSGSESVELQPQSQQVSCPHGEGGVKINDEGDGHAILKSDPTNCSSYFVCVWGKAVKLPCPHGLHFNAELKVCDWPNNVTCSSTQS